MTQTVRYDAAALKETMEERVNQYVTFRESLDVLREKMRAVTDLGEAFEGKAAEAIKGFFTAQIDVVDMWLQLVEQQIAFMEDVGAMAEDRKLGGSTKMDGPFLEDDLNAAHKRTADMIQQQHEDLSAILSRIRDLVSLEAYSPSQIELSMQDAKNKRDDTVEQMEELDQVLTDEYGLSVESETLILALIEGLLQATTQNGTFSPMSFNVHAYENSEAHAAIEASQQRSTEYIQHKQQLHEAREAQARQAELDARSGLQKFLDGTKNFVGEFSGYYDTVRASTGVDPVTGRELSASERTAAAAWAAAGIVPILGPASKVAKGGKAVFAVSKGSKAATAPLTAFKSSTQAFTRVSHAEKGIYGLVSANGLSGFFFGQDLLGNEVTAEQRTEMLMMGSMLPFGAGMKMVKGNGADVLGSVPKRTDDLVKPPLNKSNFMQLDSFKSSTTFKSLLTKHEISETELHVLVMSKVDNLSDAEKAVLKNFRDAVPSPDKNTMLQKVISTGDIENYLKDTDPYAAIGGCIAKANDVKHLNSASDVFDGLRLDYPGTKFSKDTDYAVIRFKSEEVNKLEIPYSNKLSDTPNAKSSFGYPQTGNGFTSARDGSLIPEFEARSFMKPQDGAEIFKVTNGVEELVGVYDAKLSRFIKVIE
ncbi:T7SS effector LXG polymorphic toxin [Jeotgalibacillus sp. ET6]|uniref:T7SS effector LXG polymorphic toxin n=1 Tax=Jeotgalibacillus sp. ET6 TaxID=3037260 RepID=UPI0024188562|nr:T7SS effector LXG polymorphic toxin [Jeotgalibacillus sp. ET6]MDG5471612.1 T7SS effector LXG polymorphic toxin [Jeotgalibacillus sp. ET6]